MAATAAAEAHAEISGLSIFSIQVQARIIGTVSTAHRILYRGHICPQRLNGRAE